MAAKYFMVQDWEIYGGAGKYNFFLQVYDENHKVVKDHPASDLNFGGDRWRRIGAQINRAVKKAEKTYKLQRIYELRKGYTVWIRISVGKVEVSGYKVSKRAFNRSHSYFNRESIAFVIDRVKTSFDLV